MKPVAAKLQRQPKRRRRMPPAWDPDSGRKFSGGIRDGGGQAPFARRKPVANRFSVPGKGGRLANAQKKAGRNKADQPGSGCRRKARDAPQKCADSPDGAQPKAVEQHARGHLHDRVGPVVRAGKIAEADQRDAKGFMKRLLRDRDVNPIEVVHDHAKPQ